MLPRIRQGNVPDGEQWDIWIFPINCSQPYLIFWLIANIKIQNAFQVPRLEIFVERNNTRVIKGFKIIWKHVKLFIYSDGFKILVLWIMPRAMPLSRQPINGSLLLSVETSDISSVLQVTVVSGPDMLGHFIPGKLAFFLGKTVSSKLINIWILLLRKSRAGAQRVALNWRTALSLLMALLAYTLLSNARIAK